MPEPLPSPLAHARRIHPQFSAQLIHWQQLHGRHDLPWQRNRNPYRVWVSEIMLQQTQVNTVKPYFSRFMQRFPSVQALAAADEDAVLALWAGLGYYSRARNLWRCARRITDEHQGKFPRSARALAQLPGIGPSTAAAIASICFGERISILDANAQRVLTRLLCFRQPPNTAAARRELQHCANSLLPENQQADDLLGMNMNMNTDMSTDMPTYTQALMDLGATVCTSATPRCGQCPVASLCLARAAGIQHSLPIKSKPAARKTASWYFVWLEHGDATLLTQRTQDSAATRNRIWNGLWCFPQLPAAADLDRFLQHGSEQEMYTADHALTHRKLQLHISRLSVPSKARAEQLISCSNDPDQALRHQWIRSQQTHTLGLPAPISKLLQQHWKQSE